MYLATIVPWLLATGCADSNQGGSADSTTGTDSGTDSDTSTTTPPTDSSTDGTESSSSSTSNSPTDPDSSSTSDGDSDDETGGDPAIIPDELLFRGPFSPEDVTADENRVFVSNINTGEVVVYDLTEGSETPETFIPPSSPEDTRPQAWGMRVDGQRGWLYVLYNPPWNFQTVPDAAGELRAYNVETGGLEQTWELPTGTIGNAVVLDKEGRAYVGDIAGARILQIDPDSEAPATVWADDFPAVGGVTLGGLTYDGEGSLYGTHNSANLFYRIDIGANGEAGAVEEVSITGANGPLSRIASDGMSFAGENTIFYAENDAITPGPAGTVYRIELDNDGTSGSATPVIANLRDPSGVFVAELNQQPILLVAESFLGVDFGVDTGVAAPRVLVRNSENLQPVQTGPEIELGTELAPEDVVAWGHTVFISDIEGGLVQRVDLASDDGPEDFIAAPPAGDPRPQSWGMRVDSQQNDLLVLYNAQYFGSPDFPALPDTPAELRAFDLDDGSLQGAWTMPDGTVANAVVLDAQGNYYVGDIAGARIIRVVPDTDSVTIWQDDFAPSPVSLGGMVHLDGFLYGTNNIPGEFYRVEVLPDGSAGPVEAVTILDGAEVATTDVAADGMALGPSGEIYYARNDAQTPGSAGTLYRVVLDDAGTTGQRTIVQTELADPSGTAFVSIGGRQLIVQAESQLGFALAPKAEPGDLQPYRALVIEVE